MNAIPKQAKPEKQPKYLDYIRSLPCLVCGGMSHAHHVRWNCSAKDDQYAVPLCPQHHTQGNDSFHMLGSNELFTKIHGIDLIHEAIMLRNKAVYKGVLNNG